MAKQTTLAIVTTPTNTATTFDTLGAFRSIAVAWYAADNAKDAIVAQIESLREAGIKLGKTKKCQYVQQCLDALNATFGDTKAKKTLENYVTSIRAAVNDGVEFSFSSSNGSVKSKEVIEGSEDTPASEAKAKRETTGIDVYIAKIFNHPDFADFCEKIQHSYDDADVEDMQGAIRLFLNTSGYDITE